MRYQLQKLDETSQIFHWFTKEDLLRYAVPLDDGPLREGHTDMPNKTQRHLEIL